MVTFDKDLHIERRVQNIRVEEGEGPWVGCR